MKKINSFVLVGIVLAVVFANAGLAMNPAPTRVESYQPVVVKEKPKPKPKPAPKKEAPLPIPADPIVVSNNILKLINQVRAKHGLAGLIESPALINSASRSVANMINHKSCCSHGDWTQWFDGSFAVIGENIAACQKTDQEVVQDWVGSPPHLKNILDSDFTHAGVYKGAGAFVGEYSGGEQIDCIYYANHFGGM